MSSKVHKELRMEQEDRVQELKDSLEAPLHLH